MINTKHLIALIVISISGINLPLKAQIGISSHNQSETKSNTFYKVNLSDSEAQGTFMMVSKINGGVNAAGVSLKQIIAIAYNVSAFAVFGADSLLNKRYDVETTLPKRNEQLVELMLQSAFKEKYGIYGELIEKEIEVLVLKAPNGVSKELYPTVEKFSKLSSDDGIIAGAKQSLNGNFLTLLQEAIGIVIIDETGLEGQYDFQLFWDSENSESIYSSLKNQLGLELFATKKKVNVVEVTKH